MEKRGVPTVSIVTSEFINLAKTCAEGLGVENLPITIVEHPLGGIDPALVALKADKTFDEIILQATSSLPKSPSLSDKIYPAPLVNVNDTLEDINELFYRNAWSDGLPVIPPTQERVEKTLAGTSLKPDKLIGVIPPRMGAATVQAIAINAVMAGAKPEHLPVIIAAIEAAVKRRLSFVDGSVQPGQV